MVDVAETVVPGVGVRYEFTTASGERLAVLVHRGGRREVLVYDRKDPDACRTVLHLDEPDARALSELLGGSRLTEAVASVQQQVEGLAIDWLSVPEGSPAAATSLADGEIRSRTGVSIVAIVRGDTTVPAPGPETELRAGDVVVAVGTPEGIEQLRSLLRG